MVAENILDLSALDNLSEAEREYALKILEDLAKSDGNSKMYDELKYADYNEIPVDIETFLTDALLAYAVPVPSAFVFQPVKV